MPAELLRDGERHRDLRKAIKSKTMLKRIVLV
jgi:hypothetical protein